MLILNPFRNAILEPYPLARWVLFERKRETLKNAFLKFVLYPLSNRTIIPETLWGDWWSPSATILLP
jgi:hypothetical protein